LQELLVGLADPLLDDDTCNYPIAFPSPVLILSLVSERCEKLITAIDELYNSDVDELIRARAKEGRINESDYWCELRHLAGRLLSYLQAIKILIRTRRRWPELFVDFEVHYTASSVAGPNPLRKAGNKLSADAIIGRMTSDPRLMEYSKAQAQELQKFDLDRLIQEQAVKKGFKPIVHAEVLLLEELERNGDTHPSNFFNNYKYIGCSKPSCRLCESYFANHQSGVQIRPTHRNLYPNWRMPDLFQDQGLKAENERKILMNKILLQIRKDAFRVLREKLPDWKKHDSNTEPTLPNNAPIVRHLDDDNRSIETMFESLHIGNLQDEELSSRRVGRAERRAIFPLETDDEEDGGATV
jgi:hypothetical protein